MQYKKNEIWTDGGAYAANAVRDAAEHDFAHGMDEVEPRQPNETHLDARLQHLHLVR